LLIDVRYSDCFYFFFSSRRRHTRSKRDRSSDVCSSDLGGPGGGVSLWSARPPDRAPGASGRIRAGLRRRVGERHGARPGAGAGEIGRASCRERGEMGVGGGAVKEERGEVGVVVGMTGAM